MIKRIIYLTIILSFFSHNFEDEKYVLVKNGKVFCEKDSISVSQEFYIGRYEVTILEFSEFITATGYVTYAEKFPSKVVIRDRKNNMFPSSDVCWKHASNGELRKKEDWNKYAVCFVNWEDAHAYCEWKTKLTGLKHRLPTKEEWIYAAKGGKESQNYIYAGSNDYKEVSFHNEEKMIFTGYSIGKKKSNELGIYDMTGGVGEWCNKPNNYKYPEEKYAFVGGTSYYQYAVNVCYIQKSDFQSVSSAIGFRVVKEKN